MLKVMWLPPFPSWRGPSRWGPLTGSSCSLQTSVFEKKCTYVEGDFFLASKHSPLLFLGRSKGSRQGLFFINCQLVMETICFPSLGYLGNICSWWFWTPWHAMSRWVIHIRAHHTHWPNLRGPPDYGNPRSWPINGNSTFSGLGLIAQCSLLSSSTGS